MGRKRVKTRRLTLSVTISESAYQRIGVLADNLKDGNVSQTIEMLINDFNLREEMLNQMAKKLELENKAFDFRKGLSGEAKNHILYTIVQEYDDKPFKEVINDVVN